MFNGNNIMPDRVTEDSTWTHECEDCDLPFMQSFDFHRREYHR